MNVVTVEQRREAFQEHLAKIKDFSETQQNIPEEVVPLVNDIAMKLTHGCLVKCSAIKFIDLLENFNESKAGPSDLHYINFRLDKILSAVQ
ncbi:MAG: hypothetical protein WC022_04080 [Parcubacteria group bacterium]